MTARRRLFAVARHCLLAISIGAALVSAEEAPSTGTLRVRVTNLRDKTGDVLVQLANSEAVYDSDAKAFRAAEMPVAGSEMTAVFADVPYGVYAVKFFHDVDSNRKLDIGWRGPKEAYGFSNNVMGLLGPPAFEEAKFTFASPDQTIEIKARQP